MPSTDRARAHALATEKGMDVPLPAALGGELTKPLLDLQVPTGTRKKPLPIVRHVPFSDEIADV